MKLKKIIKFLDPLDYIKIYTQDEEEDDDPAYYGVILDLPWFYLNGELDTTTDEEPIGVCFDVTKSAPYYNISLILK